MSVVNSFFYGHTVSLMEQLTIQSFIQNNHQFRLFTYDPDHFPLKDSKLDIVNANEILDHANFFVYTGNGDCPAGSVGGFSDIFRFEILKKHGSWYVDMDVTCLKNLDSLKDDIILRPNKNHGTVANIIKCNDANFCNSVLEKYKTINSSNDDWVKPLALLHETIKEYSYDKYIVEKSLFGNDYFYDLIEFLDKNYNELSNVPTHAIHWCNTACTTAKWDKRLRIDWNKPRPASLYYCLLRKYGLI